MKNDEKILDVIYSAIDDINLILPGESRLDKSPDCVIIGKDGKLDSLGLINLIVAVEAKIVEKFGVTMTLIDAKTISRENSPLRTVGTLAGYIGSILRERSDV